MKRKKLNPLQKRAIANEKALASGFMNLTKEELEKEKRRLARKNVGGFLETFSPAYSIAKGKGPIGEAVRGGKGMGILGMLASEANKGKKKSGSDAMKADAMAGADRMSGGGKIVRSKRTRSIDGIASKGKTRGTQR
tara:strand:- start:913 stop:1323 length:411 start_codon:yes stop_codon:yes gene_type:complete